jgi:hypothetical protein
MMALACPVDPGILSSLIGHCYSSIRQREPSQSLPIPVLALGTWTDLRRGLPTGHRSRPIRRGTCPPRVIGSQGTIGCSRRIGSVRRDHTALGRRPRVTLRFTSRDPRHAVHEPLGKGTGGTRFSGSTQTGFLGLLRKAPTGTATGLVSLHGTAKPSGLDGSVSVSIFRGLSYRGRVTTISIMEWHVQYRLASTSMVGWFATPEAAIEAACRLLDDGHEVSGIGTEDLTDSISEWEIARIYALWVR